VKRFGREIKGEPDRHGNAALSADEVRVVRWAYDHTEETITALARRYGVSVSAMHAIVHRRTYRHVTDEASAAATTEKPATEPAED
jgi:hypothetical protein